MSRQTKLVSQGVSSVKAELNLEIQREVKQVWNVFDTLRASSVHKYLNFSSSYENTRRSSCLSGNRVSN